MKTPPCTRSHPRSRGRAVLVGALLVAVLLLAAACTWVPTSGGVVEVAPAAPLGDTDDAEFTPSGPVPGESAASIVEGFLDAMQATPVQTTVAREFLTTSAATTWNPQQGTLVFSSRTRASGADGHLDVQLSTVSQLDSRGSWQRSMPSSTLRFSVVRQDGEWRIAAAPNRLVVPESWFQTRFIRVSLYFFDPSARILVPEPVLLPAGPQLPTELITGLVGGPAPGLRGVERTFLPAGVSGGLSVPVTHGVAQVSLTGTAGLGDTSTRMMAAQIAWTLRQDTAVQAVHIMVGGRDVTVGGASPAIPVTAFDQYDPAGATVRHTIYGLRAGVLVSSTGGSFEPVDGPWGHEPSGLRSVAVSPDATTVAGVSADGRELVVGPMAGTTRTRREIGTDLLRPAWDFAGRLWLVDAHHGRARVMVISDGHVYAVNIPGVTGRDVADFSVSFDGSRLVAVLRGGETDRVVISRLRQDSHGEIAGGTSAREVTDPSEGPIRISALAWHSPTEVVTVQQFSDTALIRTLNIDGSTPVYPGVTVTVGDHIAALVGSPQVANALYAATSAELLDLSGHGRNVPLPTGVSSLGY